MSFPEKFALSPGEKRSELWLRLKKHLEDLLEKARLRNDDAAHDPATTAAIRGEIAAYKRLLKLDRDEPERT